MENKSNLIEFRPPGPYVSIYPPVLRYLAKHFSPRQVAEIHYMLTVGITDLSNKLDISDLEKESFCLLPKLIELGVIALDSKKDHIVNPLVAFQYDEMPYHLLKLFPGTPIFNKFADHFFIVE